MMIRWVEHRSLFQILHHKYALEILLADHYLCVANESKMRQFPNLRYGNRVPQAHIPRLASGDERLSPMGTMMFKFA